MQTPKSFIMKKLLLISIVLSLVCVVKAQTTFSVPTLTEEEKYNFSRMVLNNNILALISVAKDDGMTAEELGRRLGKKYPWGEDATLEQFVNFTLRWLASNSDSVKISEQSNEEVVITVPHIYPRLENQGVIYGSSLEDLVAYYDGFVEEMLKPCGLRCNMTWGEEGLITVITVLAP